MKYNKKFEEYESVELAHGINLSGLKKGERGVVVEIYNNGEAYEIEFLKPNGGTRALLTLLPSELSPIERGINIRYNAPLVVNDLNIYFTNYNPSKDYHIRTEAKKSKEKTEEFHYQYA